MKESSPPKLFLQFFRWFCHSKLRDHIEGDLMELYSERVNDLGKRKADIKFIADVLLLFRPGIIKPLEENKNLTTYGMYKSYFKIGLRNLLRNKGYSFINICGLATGIAVTMLIGSWIYDELSFDKNNEHYDRIAQVIQNVTNNGEVNTWTSVPFPLAEELRKNYGSDLEHVVMAVQWGDHLLTYEDKKLKMTGAYFENETPQMFSFKMLQGSVSLADPASILLSSGTAKTYFGNEDPINKLMKIDNKPLVKVTGVYEDFPQNSTFYNLKFISTWDFIYSNSDWMKTTEDPWRPNFTTLFVQLKDYASFSIVSAKIKNAKLKKVNAQLAIKKPELFLHPMSQWHLYSEFKNGENVGGAIQYIRMFGIIGAFVLLIACINFMNLSTARSERRAKEVGIRKTVGSMGSQLIQQFFSESLLTVVLAFIVSLLLLQLALPFFNEVADKHIAISWTNPFFWLVNMVLILITSFIAGSYPAFYLSSFKPVKVLKGAFKAGSYSALPRKILVVMQFTISVTLIIGTVIVYQQIQYTKNRPVGYSRSNLITIPTMNPSIHKHFDAVKNELMQAGAITSMAESQSPTTGIWNSSSGLSWKGKDPDFSVDFGVVTTGYDYGKTIEWHIKEGRDFSREFLSDSSALILNEAAVHMMGLNNPVGEVISWWEKPNTVIGVVENMVIESPYDEPRPVVYGLSKEDGNLVIAKLDPAADATDALNKIETVFKKYNTEQPFEFAFVDEDYAKKFNNEERIGKLSGLFTLLAVMISCLGIFGLASFTAEQRTKEIGIRKVLGASVVSLWQMLSKDFVALVIFSCLIATPASYYFLHQWLLKYSYRTEVAWWVFGVTALGTLALTMMTVSYQAIRAAVGKPVNSLRSE